MYIGQLVVFFLLILLFVYSGFVVVNGITHNREKAVKVGYAGVYIALILLLGSYCTFI